jgi:hypothetical protein
MMSDRSLDTSAHSRAEIERTLDDLDMALAVGKIDMQLHRTLTSKWRDKLQATAVQFDLAQPPASAAFFAPARAGLPAVSESASLPSIPSAPSADMAALTGAMVGAVQGLIEQLPRDAGPASGPSTRGLACPDCGAPVATMPPPGVAARCAYCDATFTVERVEKEENRSHEELRRWLDTVVAVGAAGGTVDAASRHFIFSERLYPSLNLEATRHLEAFAALRSLALGGLHGSQLFGPQASLPVGRLDMTALRAIVSRLDAPEVRSFALIADDRQRLDELSLRVRLLLRLGTTVQQLRQGPAGYQSGSKNVRAIVELLRASAMESPGARADFLNGCALRYEAADAVLALLIRLQQPGAIDAGDGEATLIASQALLATAEQTLKSSGYAPIEVVSMQREIAAEREQLAGLHLLLGVYAASRTAGNESLFAFSQRLERFGGAVGLALSGASAVADFLAVVALWSGGGQMPIVAVHDWNWTTQAIDSQRKRGGVFGGGGESLAAQRDYWHPYFCFPLNYSVVKGSLFKGGVEESGYALVSAVGAASPVAVLAQSPFVVTVQSASPGLPADGRERAAPLRGPNVAAQEAAAHCQRQPALRNARLGAPELLYLPATLAAFADRNGQRTINLSLAGTLDGEAYRVIDAQAQLLGAL